MHIFCRRRLAANHDMIEINPITNRIADLTSRVASLASVGEHDVGTDDGVVPSVALSTIRWWLPLVSVADPRSCQVLPVSCCSRTDPVALGET